VLESIGSYDIVDELGAGGMGIVYRAVDRQLRRTVALKVIHARVGSTSSHLERFKREAEVIARLRHPNVITLYDYGEAEGLCYYTMEYLEARTLADLVDEADGPLPRQKVLELGEGLCEALAYIHAQGLVHRDVKPANIMIGADGHVTLMDFGLVKAQDLEGITKAGAIGTPRYMSPEMLKAEEADRRSDIFQLGLVLYEAATGKSAFAGRDVYVLARNVLSARPPRPSKLVKSLSRHVDTFISNCLAKNPAHRYQDADEVRQDLRRVLKNVPPLRAPADPADDDSSGSSSTASEIKKSSAVTILASSLEISRLTGPFVTFRDTPWPVKLLVCFAVAASLWYMSSTAATVETGGYRAIDVEIRPDIDAFTLVWRSDRPYPTAALVKETDAPDETYVVAESPAEPTTNHELVFDKVQRGVTYTVKIRYPDGSTSLPQAVKPLLASGLEARRTALRWSGLDAVDVVYESSLPCRSEASYVSDGIPHDVVISPGYRREHVLSLRGLAPTATVRNVTLRLATARHRRQIVVDDVLGASGTLQSFVAAVEGALPDVATVLPPLERDLRDLKDHDRARALAQRAWHGLACTGQFEDLQPLVAATFAATSPLRQPLYGALRVLESFDALLERHEHPPLRDIPALYRPFLTTSYEAGMPAGPVCCLVDLGEVRSTFLPTRPEQRPDGLVSQAGFAVLQANDEFVVNTSIDARADLRPFMTSHPADRYRLVVRVRNVTPEYFVRVSFGRHFVDFRNTRASTPPTFWGGLHGEGYQQSAEYLRSINSICVAVPRDMLTGAESFTVGLHLVPGLRALHYVQIFGLWLVPA